MHLRTLVLASLIGGVGFAARRVASSDDARAVPGTTPAPHVAAAHSSATSRRPPLPIPIVRPDDEVAEDLDDNPDEETEALVNDEGEVIQEAAAEAIVVTSAIEGRVTDPATGEELAGVTVFVNTGSHAEVAITDEHGYYKMLLPPGNYLVMFYYCDATVERSGITVSERSTTSVSQTIDSGATFARAQPDITVDDEEVRDVQIPERTFESVLGSGVSFSGRVDITNTYVTDGVDTTGSTVN